MDIKTVLESQYVASLEMLKNAVMQCPGSSWDDPGYNNKFWHTAYHALFFTHLYLQESDKHFTPWEKHREDYQFLGPLPWPPHNEPKIGEPYNKDEILAYHAFCQQEAKTRLPQTSLEAESGFYWYPCTKLELQFLNIRHIQHHAAQLIDRLNNKENISVDWVGLRPD